MLINQNVTGKLNKIFGNVVPACDQVAFAKHIASILKDDPELLESGDMPAAIQRAAVCALNRYQKLSAMALKSDSGFQEFADVIYDRLAA